MSFRTCRLLPLQRLHHIINRRALPHARSQTPSPCYSIRPALLHTTTAKMGTDNSAFEIQKLFDVKGRVALVTGGGRKHQSPSTQIAD